MNLYGYNQNQPLLFPAYIKDKLPDDHLAVIISDIVERLDLSLIYRKVPTEGHPSYHPKMMLKILIYAYATGTFSSRKIEQALNENIPYIYLSGWQIPDFRTISNFRKNNLEEFMVLFKQVARLCQELGMVELGHVSIDGTKIKANASDARTYNDKRLEKEIEKLVQEAKATDAKEDGLYGSGSNGDDIPKEIRKQKDRLEKLKQLQEKLSQSEKEKFNLTDPDASFMKTRNGVKTSYNSQVVVDEEHRIIAAQDVTSKASDTGELCSMVEQTQENTGQKIAKCSADAGYSSGENLNQLEQKGIDAYIPDREYQHNLRKGKQPTDDRFHKDNFSYNEQDDTLTCPEGKKLSFAYFQKSKGKEPLRIYRYSKCQQCPSFSQCTKNKNGRTISRHPYEKELKAMREKLDSPEGKAIYGKRKSIVEPVFGIIKNVMGFTSFLLRGLNKVRGEFSLVTIAYNIKKIASFFCSGDKYALLRMRLKYMKI